MPPDPRRLLAARVYYGWVIVVACFLASVAVYGTSYAFGVFYDAFVATFDATEAVVAVVFGLQTALIYVAGVGVARLLGRYGRRRVAAAAAATLVAGLVWTALARTYLELLAAFGVVAAVGMAGLYIVGYATLPEWFGRRRGAATSAASAGLGVGLVVVPPGADLAVSALGWRAAMLAIAGFVGLLGAVIAVLFADAPADVGADTAAEFPAADDTPADAEAGADLRAVVASAPFLLVFLGWALVFAPLYAVLSHVVVYAESAGLGRATGVTAIAVVGVVTTAVRVGVGPLADRFGRTRAFVVCGALLGASTVGVAAAPTAALFLAAVVGFGAGYGGCGGLLGAITADLFGRRSLNTLFAVLSLSFAVAGLAAPPLAGLWFEATGDYRLAFAVAGAAGLVGAACVAVGARIGRPGPATDAERAV